MNDVDCQLVREFFELNRFRVLTHWRRDAGRAGGEQGLQLYVENSNPQSPEEEAGLVLTGKTIGQISRAVVEIRAWHGEPFYPSVVAGSPVLKQFVQEAALEPAREHFAHRPFATILVISDLPVSSEPRARSLRLFQESGIDHLLEFPAILQSMLDRIDVNSAYNASNTLQLLRILKRYRFIRNQQMEFSFPMDVPDLETPARVETAEATGSGDDV